MRFPMRASVLVVGVLLAIVLRQPTWAVDGVIEINQVKALAGGVTASDQPGFPVSIVDTMGSFRLTSNLVVPDAETHAFVVSTFGPENVDVTIDLNGFSILGPVECTRDVGETLCSDSGSGDGITVGSFGVSLTLTNGTIRGMGRDGVHASFATTRARIHNVSVVSNARSGLSVNYGHITDCRAELNGENGIFATGGGLITGCVVRENGDRGISSGPGNGIGGNNFQDNTGAAFVGGVVIAPNVCDSALCP